MTCSHQGLLDITARQEDLAKTGLAEAERINADEAKISADCAFEKTLVIENKELALSKDTETQTCRIAVHANNKRGSASVNTGSSEVFARSVQAAMDLASFSVEDPHLRLPGADIASPAAPLDFMYDDATAMMSLDELKDGTREILDLFKADPKIAIDRFEVSHAVSNHALFNSHGVRQSERQSMVHWTWMGMAVDGDEVSGFDYDYDFAFAKQDFVARAKPQAIKFMDNLKRMLKPQKSPSYNGAVLLAPGAFCSILAQSILYHIGGRAVMDGKSRWIDAIGDKVVSDKLTLTDNAHNPRLSGATSFDQDGFATKKLSIVDQGVLKSHLHNYYTAGRTETESTHQSGGPFGLEIKGGDRPLADMRGSAETLLEVHRFSGNNDTVRGDFSGVAKSSRLVKSGKDSGPVSETMIAANFFDIADRVLAVSEETEIVHGSIECPWVLLDGVSVTG